MHASACCARPGRSLEERDSAAEHIAEDSVTHTPAEEASLQRSTALATQADAARAAAVARRLIEVDGLNGGTLDAVGYSDTRPLVPKSDPESLTKNRRVDLLVRSEARPEVRALLPALEATRS